VPSSTLWPENESSTHWPDLLAAQRSQILVQQAAGQSPVLVPELTSEARKEFFGQATGFHKEPVAEAMKRATKNGKPGSNGVPFTRRELLAAHERALKRADKTTAQEGFASLAKAGICTPDGKLSPRYGG